MGIIVLTAVVLVCVKLAIPIVEERNSRVLDEIKTENNSLAQESKIDLVFDVQTRLNQIKKNLQIKNNEVSRPEMTDVLSNLATDSIAGVAVSLYKFENNKVTATFNATNFNDIAKQILNFKKSAYFKNANVISVGRGKEEGVTCIVEMDI